MPTTPLLAVSETQHVRFRITPQFNPAVVTLSNGRQRGWPPLSKQSLVLPHEEQPGLKTEFETPGCAS